MHTSSTIPSSASSSTRVFRNSRIEGARADIGGAVIDARVLALFDDDSLRSGIRRLEKVELSRVWHLTERALVRIREEGTVAEPLSELKVHRRILEGLAGETLLVSSAMFLKSLSDAEKFFELSFKTIKRRQSGSLTIALSERAMRAARVTMTAAEMLGSYDAAREYMHTRNFALGGATPAELIRTSEGERIVLNELQTQTEAGPL